MAIIKSKKLRKVLRVAAIAVGAWYAAPYLLTAAGGVTAAGTGQVLTGVGVFAGGLGRSGGGRPPPETQQSPGGQTFFIGGTGPSGGNVGYSDIGAGGAGAGIYPGGGFDSPVSRGISPGLLLGIAGGGLALTILIMLIRR